ncbi:MAG: AAA family ATPase [Bacteroidales bacterium]|nr:AAA family ATPase [Bacteroidales bacterium]
MAICKKCNTDNRGSARFCKKCGTSIEAAASDVFSGYYGKENLYPEIEKFRKMAAIAGQLKNSGGAYVGLDCILSGDTGTGKNFIAEKLNEILLKARVITQSKISVVDAADYEAWSEKFDDNLDKAKDGVLMICNAQKLLPSEESVDINDLDRLFSRMSRSRQNMPVIFLSGLRKGMEGFLSKNTDIARLFEFRYDLKALDEGQLVAICLESIKEKYRLKVADGVADKLKGHFTWLFREGSELISNGHLSEIKAQELAISAIGRGSDKVEPQDVTGKVFVPRTEAEIWQDLDKFIGMKSVKDEIRSIVDDIKETKRSKGNEVKVQIKDHFVFTGNPGTGKTTMARCFADILNALGVLPKGHLVEVGSKDLIGDVIGASERNVRDAVDKAMGGILFIDEAYGLNDGTSYGQGAIDTLLKLVEDNRGKFICIIAGYSKEMGDFMRQNSGLESRFNKVIDFPDYNARELEAIFRITLKSKGFTLDSEAEDKIAKHFDMVHLKRGANFGNARVVRNIFSEAERRYKSRRSKLHGAAYDDAEGILTWPDIAGEEGTKDISVDDVMKELDSLIGMTSVKEAIREIGYDLFRQRKAMEFGIGKATLTPVNIVLTGNPGTGKTTIARKLGKLFKALGLTASDKVVEKTPKDIVSGFVNCSDKNMDDAVNEAMGGVLFLDEAYAIAPVDAAGQCTNPEGKKALEALLTRMENDRGKFVVIAAGYRNKMNDLIRANEGFKSRFTHFLHIEDYTADELCRIFMNMLKSEALQPENDSVSDRALKMFERMTASKDEKFGNAREARKVLDQTKRNLASRLKEIPFDAWTPELMTTIIADDIPFEEAKKLSPDECLAELDALVGLSQVKDAMKALINSVNRATHLAKLTGEKAAVMPGHFMFLGNPGTGKTTVARMMGKILHSMGVIQRPDVIEVDKSKMVGRYVGDTEAITTEVINSAMGGILFIDEAYSLAGDQFGRNALDTLLKQLEDKRDRFVCIVAGYTKEMQAFVDANSGIRSRFPERNWITFEDYNDDELFQIFANLCKKEKITMTDEASTLLRARFKMIYLRRDDKFGNAREARNMFESVKAAMATRTSMIDSPTLEDLKTIQAEDIR